LFEILTWAQIGLHRKPVGLLNTRHYFDPLLQMVEHARAEGFIYDEHRALFSFSDNPETLLDELENHTHPDGLEKWLTREK
jgi:predicted Rossmann-fold nucleotide-binding protein